MRMMIVAAPKRKSTRILAFNAVGIVGFAVQIGALWLLVRVGGLPAVAATAIAVETAVVHNFVCHWCWTWSDRVGGPHEFLLRFVRFNLTNGAVSVVVNVVLMALLQHVLGLHYLVANLAGVACSSFANFILGDRVVFATSAAAADCGRGRRHRSPRTFAISSRSAGRNGATPPATSI
jgi:putative flippase GtrA